MNKITAPISIQGWFSTKMEKSIVKLLQGKCSKCSLHRTEQCFNSNIVNGTIFYGGVRMELKIGWEEPVDTGYRADSNGGGGGGALNGGRA